MKCFRTAIFRLKEIRQSCLIAGQPVRQSVVASVDGFGDFLKNHKIISGINVFGNINLIGKIVQLPGTPEPSGAFCCVFQLDIAACGDIFSAQKGWVDMKSVPSALETAR